MEHLLALRVGGPQHSALCDAAKGGHYDLVCFLLDKGVDISERPGLERWTALHTAVLECHLDVIRVLLDKGADMSATDFYNKENALQFAAEGGDVEVISLLLERGADLSEMLSKGYCALYVSAGRYCVEAVELLLGSGVLTGQWGGYIIVRARRMDRPTLCCDQ